MTETQTIRVRVARPDDRAVLVALVTEMDAADGEDRAHHLAEAPIGAALRAVYPPVLLAEVDGENGDDGRPVVAGVLLFHRVQPALLQSGALFVDDLFVRPAFRRRGVGTALVDEVKRIASMEERVQVDLLARKGNSDGFAFYERLGAKRFDDIEAVRFQVEPKGRAHLH